MIGKNLLWLAKQLGHSVPTMLTTYAAWIEGSNESDIKAIEAALNRSGSDLGTGAVTRLSPAPSQFGVSKRMRWEMYGGKGGTRTLDPGIMSAVL
jgi:hypothetical protein